MAPRLTGSDPARGAESSPDDRRIQAESPAAAERAAPLQVPAGPVNPASVMALQRLVGNAAVAGMLDEQRRAAAGGAGAATAALDGAAGAAGGAAGGARDGAAGAAGGAPASETMAPEDAASASSPASAKDDGARLAGGPGGGSFGGFGGLTGEGLGALAGGAGLGSAAGAAAGAAGRGLQGMVGAAGQLVEGFAGGAANGAVQAGVEGVAGGAAGAGAVQAGVEGVAGGAAGGAAQAAVQGAAGGAAPGGAAAATAAGGAAAGTAGAAAGAAKETAAGGGAAGAAGAAGAGAKETAGAAGRGAAAPAGEAAVAGGATGGAAEPTTSLSPEDDPKFKAMKGKAKAAGEKTKAHQPAAAGAASAQAAAQPPSNDLSSQAQAAQVEEMGEKQPKTFDRAAFIAAVKKAIDAAAPKNLEEADEFKDSGKAAKVKDEVGTLVKGGKKESEKDIKQATDAPPDTSKAKPKQVVPLAPEDPGTKPAGVGAAEAMPGPRPAEETDLSQGPAEVEGTMEEAGVTDQQLRNSNEPEFNAAVDAKETAKEHAQQAPQEYRGQEQETLAKSREEAEGISGVRLEGMQASKVSALAKVAGHKTEAKSADEQKRAKVASDIQGIYEKTKTDVTSRLDALDGKVDAAFTKGEASARKQFEDYVSEKMEAYKDDRYSGVFGWARWLDDKLFGMPDEVNVFYTQGRDAYLVAMDQVIGEVADLVGNELNAARLRIAEGRAEVRNYVAALPADLQQVGKEAEEKLESQFEQLTSDVDSKQDAMVDQLAQKYVEARDSLDARIEEMKAANRGLVAKALDAVVGVVKTILRLKDLLLSVLAKAADVIGDIITDPIGFLGRLVDGVKSGLNRFVDNIGAHLEKGLLGWLFGALGDAGIQLPKTFDLAGIFDLVMQVLGLTYSRIRARVAKIVGEPVVEKMEQTVDVFKILAGKGIGGLWEWIKEKIGDFQEVVLGGIKSFIIERVIKGGVMWLLSLLNPAAAFVKACIAIYDIVMFIVERGQEIIEFVNSILDSIGAIARGNISIVAEKVENALARALPLAISFLASLLRLGGITDKIKEGIELVRKPIEKAVDFVVMGAVKGFKKLFGGAIGWVKGKYEKGKQWATEKATAAKEWGAAKVKGVKEKVFGKDEEPEEGAERAEAAGDQGPEDFVEKVTMAGKEHTVEADPDDGSVTIASKKGGIYDKAKRRRDAILKHEPVPEEEAAALLSIMEVAQLVKLTAARARGKALGSKEDDAWSDACKRLIAAISDYGQRFNARDIDPPEEAEEEAAAPDMAELLKTAVHVRPADYSRGKHVQGTTDDERRESSKKHSQFLVGLSDADIAALERDTLLTGELVPRAGGSYHAYKEYDRQIGWDGGDKAFWLRAELSAGRIHSHPRKSR